MPEQQRRTNAPLVAAVGGFVAVLGALTAVIASGATSPIWYGVIIALALVLLVLLGISLADGRKRRRR